jgi:hypothetical protein
MVLDSSSMWVKTPESDNHRLGGSWSRRSAMPHNVG